MDEHLDLLATAHLWVAPSKNLTKAVEITSALPRPRVKIEDLWDKHQTDAVESILDAGAASIWVDAKLSGIPSMVEERVLEIAESGAHYISVMASSGIATMMAACDAASRRSCEIVAVTVPTSLSRTEAELSYGRSPEAQVLHFAQQAYLSGVRKVVCSPKEVALLSARRELQGMKFWVTGIRPKGKTADDHQRSGTIEEAFLGGAHSVVVGRRFMEAPDPRGAYELVKIEIVGALSRSQAK